MSFSELPGSAWHRLARRLLLSCDRAQCRRLVQQYLPQADKAQFDYLEENRCDGVLRTLGVRQRRAPADEVGALFRHHQYAGVDVRGDEIRHRRSITDTQAFDAVYFELRV